MCILVKIAKIMNEPKKNYKPQDTENLLFDRMCFFPSNNYYDTEVVVDGNKYRIGFDSVYLSLQNNRTTGWELWHNYPPNPIKIGNEFKSKEFKIYIKGVLVYSNTH